MASNLIIVLAASGLVAAGTPAVNATRSSDAMPASRVALVQAAPAKALGGACFVPTKNGKLPSLAEIRKAKAVGKCGADTHLAAGEVGAGGAGAGGGAGTGMLIGAGVVAVGSTVLLVTCSDRSVSGC